MHCAHGHSPPIASARARQAGQEPLACAALANDDRTRDGLVTSEHEGDRDGVAGPAEHRGTGEVILMRSGGVMRTPGIRD
jgi:hypothetical protein